MSLPALGQNSSSQEQSPVKSEPSMVRQLESEKEFQRRINEEIRRRWGVTLVNVARAPLERSGSVLAQLQKEEELTQDALKKSPQELA
jgi:hypothetical protein